MDIQQEVRKHLILTAIADLFVALISFISGTVILISAHIIWSYVLSTIVVLFHIGVMGLSLGVYTYYQIKLRFKRSP